MWSKILMVNSVLCGLCLAGSIFTLGSSLLLEGSWKATGLALFTFACVLLMQFALSALAFA